MPKIIGDVLQSRVERAWGARDLAETDGAHSGDEHVAHPVGEARILVVERKGSV